MSSKQSPEKRAATEEADTAPDAKKQKAETREMKAVYVTKESVELKTAEISEPGKGEVLIKNEYVASNPKDWKLAHYGIFEGVEGNDVAGYVEAVGEGVEEFKKGDKVAAFTKMRTADKYGAYQEYSIAPASCTWPVAEKTPLDEAATLPLAMMTAAIGLFVNLGMTHASGSPSTTHNPNATVVINGASSSVGAFAVQLSHLAKYKVVGIAGASGEYAKSLGADLVVDYRNKSQDELAQAVKEAVKELGQPLIGVYDAVSQLPTTKTLVEQVMQPRGGKITTVLEVLAQPEESPENVTVIRTFVGSAYGGNGQDNEEFAKAMYRTVGNWLDQGIFKANKVKLMPKGLASVEEGLKLLKDGKVSGEKLVYKISDTP